MFHHSAQKGSSIVSVKWSIHSDLDNSQRYRNTVNYFLYTDS